MTIFVLGITNIPLGLVEMVRKMFIIIHTIVLILQAMPEVVVHLGVRREIAHIPKELRWEVIVILVYQTDIVKTGSTDISM